MPKTPSPSELWVSDFDDLTGPETDRALALIGIEPTQIGANMFALACAVAVVIRQRTDPSVPDSTWATLRIRDVDLRSSVNPADLADPS